MQHNVDMNDPSSLEMIGLYGSLQLSERYLAESHGMPTMSTESMKGMLVNLSLAFKEQVKLNEALIQRVKKLESKKPWYRRR